MSSSSLWRKVRTRDLMADLAWRFMFFPQFALEQHGFSVIPSVTSSASLTRMKGCLGFDTLFQTVKALVERIHGFTLWAMKPRHLIARIVSKFQ